MAVATLDDARQIVDQLSPQDQAQLLEYLAPRIARAEAAAQNDRTGTIPASEDAWETLFRVGDEIAEHDTPGSASLTAAISAMRR